MSSDSSQKEDVERVSWMKRLLNKDTSRFNAYIQSTTAHGVMRIFISKSYIRRLFWLVVVLGAATGCLYNVSDRIMFLASKPTSTTVSTKRGDMLFFPAVTICNLNRFRRSVLAEIAEGFNDVIREVFYNSDNIAVCKNETKSLSSNFLSRNSLQDISYIARHTLEDFILGCHYQGRECDITRDFYPILTRLGVCYTFNAGPMVSGQPVMTANGTGARFGLTLLVNINQSDYVASTNFDAGVKVAVHPQNEPPQPDDRGIGVPPGSNAFISMRQQNITDNTRRNCKTADEVSDFNFVREEYNYSVSACIEDCFYTSVADKCGCIEARQQYGPDTETFRSLPECTLENLCCEIQQTISPQSCNCNQACKTTSFITTNSYSSFPAEFAIVDILSENNITQDVLSPNFLSVNVYYETPNVEVQTTNDAYSAVALLSDIGGQLGLFLGVSFISVLEFVTWLIDETKDRVFGTTEKKMCCFCRQGNHKEVEVSDRKEEGVQNGNKDDYHSLQTKYELHQTKTEAVLS